MPGGASGSGLVTDCYLAGSGKRQPRRRACAARHSGRAARRARSPAAAAHESAGALRAPPRARNPARAIRCARRRLSAASTCGTLPLGAEVRAQPRAQVARPTDVEHFVVSTRKKIDARPRRRAERELALVEHAPRTGGREGDELGDGSRSALLCEPISASKTSAVACASGRARWHGCTDVPKK